VADSTYPFITHRAAAIAANPDATAGCRPTPNRPDSGRRRPRPPPDEYARAPEPRVAGKAIPPKTGPDTARRPCRAPP